VFNTGQYLPKSAPVHVWVAAKLSGEHYRSLTMTLKQKTFSAVRWNTIAAVVKTLLQLAQTAILARLLVPADYGLMAMAGVVSGFALIFSDLGLNAAYLQKRNVTREERSSLFWMNLGVSTFLAVLMVILSPLLAQVFGDKQLVPILILSSTVFVFSSLGQQIKITAEKALDFRPVAILDVSSVVAGFVVAAIAALNGCGVYSLVYGNITASITESLFAWLFLSNDWRPQLRFTLEDIRPYMAFGGAAVGNSMVGYLNMSFDLLLGGRLLGAESLGLFSVPRNLILRVQMLVNPIVTRVGIPLVVHIQDDIPRVRAVYSKAINMISSCSSPIYIGLAFFAPDVIRVLLGRNWGGSVELLRILAAWGLIRSMGNPVGILLYGMGHAALSLKWNLMVMLISPFVLWFGSLYGAKGVSIAMLSFMVLLFIPGWAILIRPLCGLKFLDYVADVFKPMGIALIAIIPAFLVASSFQSVVLRLLIGGFISVPLYLFLGYKFNKDWFNSVTELISGGIVERLWRGRNSSAVICSD